MARFPWVLLILSLACNVEEKRSQEIEGFAASKVPVEELQPHLEGFALFERWPEIGRTMPCMATDYDGAPSKECIASDSVTLVFRRDSLVLIIARVQVLRNSSAATYWGRNRDRFIKEFGALPDSVTVGAASTDDLPAGQVRESSEGARMLVAHWAPNPVRYWGANVILRDIPLSTGPGVMGQVLLFAICDPGSDCSDSVRKRRFHDSVKPDTNGEEVPK